MKQFTSLFSERLLLRPIQLSDADSVFEYRSNVIVNQYQGWIPITINDVRDFITNKVSTEINLPGTWFQLVVIEKSTNQLIGDIGIHFMALDSFHVELGCTLHKDFQGRGFAAEALSVAINYLFDELNKHRIIASIDARNLSSIRLFERLGFRREAHFRESFFANGEWNDELVYAILKSEWNAKRVKFVMKKKSSLSK